MSYWRKGEGLDVIETVARWLIEQAAFKGLTLHDYVDGLCSLTDLGATTENASATLKSRIPNAHLHYNEHGASVVKFMTWESWFSARVRNRIYYFFHRHTDEGKLSKAWAEWPLPIPERPRCGQIILQHEPLMTTNSCATNPPEMEVATTW